MSESATFPKTLEQLRAEQTAIMQRHEPSITELPNWYAEQLRQAEKAAEPPTVDEMLEAAAQAGRQAAKPAQRMEYEDARAIFWQAMIAEAKMNGRTPEVDDGNREHIRETVRWAIADPAGKWDAQRGLAFLGNVGAGKTYIMRVLRRFLQATRMPVFEWETAPDVFDLVAEDSEQMAAFYALPRCFDDFGQEPPSLKSYGNQIEVMGGIIVRRHARFEKSGLLTHLTSNLTLDEIESRYGTRVSSRILQMCNVIEFGGGNRRN